jgi:predicted branched-subunit amino acid permease
MHDSNDSTDEKGAGDVRVNGVVVVFSCIYIVILLAAAVFRQERPEHWISLVFFNGARLWVSAIVTIAFMAGMAELVARLVYGAKSQRKK